MKELMVLLSFICLFFCALLKFSGLHANSSINLRPINSTVKQLRCYNSYGTSGQPWLPLWDANSDKRGMRISCSSNQTSITCDWAGYVGIGFNYDSGGTWGSPTCDFICANTNTTSSICDWK